MSASHPATPEKWLVEWFAGPTSATGLHVSIDTSKRLTAVTAALRVIAETQATIPLLTYRRLTPKGKARAVEHPLYKILHNQANPWQTAFEFKRLMTHHAAAGGVAYARIVSNGRGEIEALVPLLPSRVRPVVREDGTIAFEYRRPNGPGVMYRFEEVFKLLAFSEDGVTSKSLIETCQEAVGVGMAAEEFAARFYGNNGTPQGVLTHPKALSQPAKDRLRAEWERRYSGAQNFGKTALLEEGMGYQAIGVSFKDAQFLESRKFQVTEIARLFRIPPHMLGDLERSTFTNIEHQGQEFVTYTMATWLVMWEQAIWRDLLTTTEQADLFAEHLVDSLLRGDSTARNASYTAGRNGGWLSANDVREKENLNPIEGGDVYLIPMNMVDASAPPAPPAPPAPTRAIEPDEDVDRSALARILEDPWRRVERRASDRTAKVSPRTKAAINAALAGQADYIVGTVGPIALEVGRLLGCADTSVFAGPLAGLAQDYLDETVEGRHDSPAVWAQRTVATWDRIIAREREQRKAA